MVTKDAVQNSFNKYYYATKLAVKISLSQSFHGMNVFSNLRFEVGFLNFTLLVFVHFVVP